MARSQSRQRIAPNVTGKINVTLIVEGITEKLYFQQLNQLNYFPNLSFSIKTIGSKDKWRRELISTLSTKVSEDYVVLLLDVDNDTDKMKEIERLIKKDYNAGVLKKVLFYNNVAFELFLLNHKLVYQKPVAVAKEYDSDIKKAFGLQSYRKRETEIITIMKQISNDDVDSALKRIERISQKYIDNPATNMIHLFEKLKKIKR